MKNYYIMFTEKDGKQFHKRFNLFFERADFIEEFQNLWLTYILWEEEVK